METINTNEGQNAEAGIRSYRHVNQLKITPAPWLPDDSDGFRKTVTNIDTEILELQQYEETENNMKLICAAPDMYEALSEIIDWKYHLDLDSETVNMIRKALNKAAGKTVD